MVFILGDPRMKCSHFCFSCLKRSHLPTCNDELQLLGSHHITSHPCPQQRQNRNHKSVHFFLKSQIVNILQFQAISSLFQLLTSYNYLPTYLYLGYSESSHGQHAHKCLWLCPNKTAFTNTQIWCIFTYYEILFCLIFFNTLQR